MAALATQLSSSLPKCTLFINTMPATIGMPNSSMSAPLLILKFSLAC